MKTNPKKSPALAATAFIADAFTLIELLVVIAIIAILAAMLLPVIAVAQKHAKVTQAKTEIANIHNAITAYESDYSRFPVSSEVQAAGYETFTCGGTFKTPSDPAYQVGTTNKTTFAVYTTNSIVMAILLDYTNYPNGYLNGTFTDNTNFQKNPKQTVYLANVKPSNWDPAKGGTPQPGIGDDLVYRDPWGNPYIITMDLDEDNQTYDPFYLSASVSSSTGAAPGSGYNGLNYRTEGSAAGYAFHGNVMVWSAGPDGQLDPTNSAIQGLNKDNVLSWAQ